MCDHTISLHLSKAQTTIARPALRRLPRQHHQRSRRTGMNLIVHHMLQALIEDGSHKDTRCHLLARRTTIQDFVGMGLQLEIVTQHRRQSIYAHIRKRTAISHCADFRAQSSHERLHQVGNRHAARNTMRVDNDVWNDTRRRLRHILRFQDHSHCTLLSVTGTKLISNRRHTLRPHANLDKGESLAVPSMIDLVHESRLVVAQHLGGITEPLSSRCLHRRSRLRRRHRGKRTVRNPSRHCSLYSAQTDRHNLSNQNIVVVHIGIFLYHTILPQLFVVGEFGVFRQCGIRLTESLLLARCLILLLLILVRSVEDGTEQSTIQRCAIDHHGIFLIVATIRHNRHHDIVATRHFLCQIVLAHVRRHKRSRRVKQQIAHRIHTL